MKQLLIILMFSLYLIGCNEESHVGQALTRLPHMKKSTRLSTLQLKLQQLPETTFRFPVGDSVGHGYYIAQCFQDTINGGGGHLGIDINGVGGGNTDLGDVIYSIGDGIVDIADPIDYLSVYYKYNKNIIKVVYYHCQKIYPKAGDFVKKGQKIATIGNSEWAYWAHLHLEFIADTSIYVGFYGDPKGFLDPYSILPHYKKGIKKRRDAALKAKL